MARAGYCRHGSYIGNGKQPEPVEIEFEGVKKIIQMPKNECWECAREEKARRDQEEWRQTHEKNTVKHNFLKLLKEDEKFAQDVKKLLGIPGSNRDKILKNHKSTSM